MKPDLAAPGNKIVSLEAKGSRLSNNYPYLHRAGSGSNAYMQLSGTSMAAPIVSGAVALLLQGSPNMNPSQVKLALQMGSSFMPEAGLIGAGAGSVDIMASRKSSANGLLTLVNTATAGLLSAPSGASFWDEGTLAHRLYMRTGPAAAVAARAAAGVVESVVSSRRRPEPAGPEQPARARGRQPSRLG